MSIHLTIFFGLNANKGTVVNVTVYGVDNTIEKVAVADICKTEARGAPF